MRGLWVAHRRVLADRVLAEPVAADVDRRAASALSVSDRGWCA